MKRMISGVVIGMLLFTSSVFAIPTLQLYADGASYDAGTKTLTVAIEAGTGGSTALEIIAEINTGANSATIPTTRSI